MSWYKSGFDSAGTTAPRKSGTSSLRRLWMPNNTDDREITILDRTDEPSIIGDEKIMLPFLSREHNLKLDGHWRNWFSCAGRGCPLCDDGQRSYEFAVFTVIDHDSWTDKNGVEYVDQLKLWVVKTSSHNPMWPQIRRLQNRKGNLRGCRVSLSRFGDKSPSSGSQLEFLDQLDESQLIAKYGDKPGVDVANYVEIFTPKSAQEIAQLTGIGQAYAPAEVKPPADNGWGTTKVSWGNDDDLPPF